MSLKEAHAPRQFGAIHGASIFGTALFAIRARPFLALKAIWWLMTRRRTRGRAALSRAASAHVSYYGWAVRLVEQSMLADYSSAAPNVRPIFIVDGWDRSSPASVNETTSSIFRVFGDVTCIGVLGDSAGKLNTALDPRIVPVTISELIDRLECATAPVIFVRCGDIFSPLAAPAIANAAVNIAGPWSVYWDEDQIDSGGNRMNPWFKPKWNRLQFLAQDYVSYSSALPAAHVVRWLREHEGEALDVSALTTWVLLHDAAMRVLKIDLILNHRRGAQGGPSNEGRYQAVADLAPNFLVARKPDLPVDLVTRPLAGASPSVTIIVPTRDQLAVLEPCIQGLLNAKYPGRKDILIVDNGSTDSDTLGFLAEMQKLGVKVIRDDSPFNYSALNNRAAAVADTDLLCFVNNDVEPVGDEWLQTMAGFALEPNVGAVGAKLLYPDGSVQHAGVAIGMGGAAGHLLRGRPNDSSIFHGLIDATRYSTAVTAACLLVSKAKYDEAGGFDESCLAVAFNDVDLCLKLADRGYDNVYAPAATLIHHESKSRGLDLSGEKKRRFERELQCLKQRWNTETRCDPYFHPWLSRADESLSFGW